MQEKLEKKQIKRKKKIKNNGKKQIRKKEKN